MMFFFYNDEAGKDETHGDALLLQSILLGITSSRSLVFRRGDIKAVAQGELDAAAVVVLHLANHKAIAVEGEAVDAAIEEVVACQFDVETPFEEVLADAEREHWIGAVEPCILLVAVRVHVEVSLQQPVVR